MFKKKKGRRFLALLLAIMCMVTTAAPSFAMGFDDLQTVIDMTTGGENSGDDFYDFPEDIAPGQEEDVPAPSEDAPPEEAPPAENTPPTDPSGSMPEILGETPPEENKAPAIVDSGTPPNSWLIPDDYVLTIGPANWRPLPASRSERSAPSLSPSRRGNTSR